MKERRKKEERLGQKNKDTFLFFDICYIQQGGFSRYTEAALCLTVCVHSSVPICSFGSVHLDLFVRSSVHIYVSVCSFVRRFASIYPSCPNHLYIPVIYCSLVFCVRLASSSPRLFLSKLFALKPMPQVLP